MHIIAIYKPPKTQISYFTSILETILEKKPINCPPIIIGDFNIHMLTKLSQATISQNFMNKCNFIVFMFKATTICNTQLVHILQYMGNFNNSLSNN
jgi:hypothetical protein